ncbi:Sodium/pyruvate cotransporter BASS2, chloroplastic [Linum perenne]
MASMSRFVAKDCHLTTCAAAVHKPSSSSLCTRRLTNNAHLDPRGWSLAPKNGRICALQSKPISTASPILHASRYMAECRNSVVLCNAATNLSGDVPSSNPAVTWLETDLFTLGLGFLMLSMGLTLKFEDFRRCLRNPWTVGVGFLAQYLIKPLLGFLIAMLFYNRSYYHDTTSYQASCWSACSCGRGWSGSEYISGCANANYCRSASKRIFPQVHSKNNLHNTSNWSYSHNLALCKSYWASCRCVENTRSTTNTSSSFSACRCICHRLLDFKVVIW